jgi:hypothetical protein
MAASSPARWFWIVVGLAWIAAVAVMAHLNWPHVSLDLPGRDPAVRAAYDAAVRAHLIWHAFLALVPPTLLFLLVRIFRSRG